MTELEPSALKEMVMKTVKTEDEITDEVKKKIRQENMYL